MYRIQQVEWDGNGDPVYTDIYNPDDIETKPVTGPKCQLEISEPGGLQFTLLPGHPLIDTLSPVSTYVRVLDGDEEIFYGKILQKSDPAMTGRISFSCSGALSFLLDSEVPPFSKNRSGQVIPQHWSAETFFRWCVTKHNEDISDPRRQLTVGTISATKKSVEADYQISSYTQTKNALDTNLISPYGGYLRTRRSNGVLYIDWIQEYDTVDAQEITLGKNIIDQTAQIDGTSFFTAIRPVGANDIVLPERTIDLFGETDMEAYGRIVKTIQFSGASNVTSLRSQAEEYKSRIEKQLFADCDVRFVDMHYIDGTSPKIRLGNRFTNIHGMSGIEMIAASLDLNLDAPQNDSVALKNRRSLEGDMTPEGNAHGGKTLSGSSRKSAGQFFKYLKETGETLEVTAKQVVMQGDTLIEHYNLITASANQIETLSRREDAMENMMGTISRVWSDITIAVDTVLGSEVLQNDHTIASIAGNFETWELPSGRKVLRLKDGSDLEVDDGNGVIQNVGKLMGEHTSEIDGTKTQVDLITGSALWTQRDGITGVTGEFEIQMDPVTGKKTLVVKSGGGMKLRRDNVEYGLYDEGTLTGGIVVSKLNESTTATLIRGDIIDLSTNDGYVSILATTTNITTQVNQKSRVFVQMTDPATETGVTVRNGDLWYQRPDNTTWDSQNGSEWDSLNEDEWKSLYGTVHYVRKNGEWVLVVDTATILESSVKIEHDNEHWAALARQVDAMGQEYNSNINVTAQRINTDVSAARSQLYSTIYSTATNIVSKVEDVESSLQSNIEQTASRITTSVSAAKSALYSTIEQTATQIRSYVADEVNDLNSSITQTASQIRSEVNAAKSTLYSSITQTASQIRLEVADSVSNLQSSITTQANRISLVVEGTGANAKIKPAAIVSSINDGASTIVISASHVNLDGYVKASDITVNYLAAKFANSSVLSTNYIFSKSLEVGTGTFTINGYACALENGIHSLQITSSGNTYTLQGKHFYSSDWYTIGSFSRATSLSGSWSGSVAGGKSYHVTASPQGNDAYSPSLDQIYYTAASKTWANDKKSFTQLIRVCDDQAEDLYEETLTFDTETSYNTGYDTGGATAYVYPTVYTQNRSGYTVDSEVTIPAGETRYVVGVFTNRSGNAQWGAAKSMKVTAGTSSHSPTIDQVWTSSGIPSGATELNSLKTQYENAKDDGDNFCIRVKCGSKTKTYYCSP